MSMKQDSYGIQSVYLMELLCHAMKSLPLVLRSQKIA